MRAPLHVRILASTRLELLSGWRSTSAAHAHERLGKHMLTPPHVLLHLLLLLLERRNALLALARTASVQLAGKRSFFRSCVNGESVGMVGLGLLLLDLRTRVVEVLDVCAAKVVHRGCVSFHGAAFAAGVD